MKCYVFVPEQISFDGADLCIILGNLIDNAMEAAGNLPEGRLAHGGLCIAGQRKPHHHGTESL